MRLLIVSNRLPLTVAVEDGELIFHESVGGLVSGLSSYLASIKDIPASRTDYLWIGWPGISVEERLQHDLQRRLLDELHAWPIFIDETVMDDFYHGFCNKTLWPLFHYFPSYTNYNQTSWETYQEVNRQFCDTIMQIAQPDDMIWIQDYHLMLLPRLLRERAPELKIGFFLHIPFPSYEIFRLLPSNWRADLLRGLLGADLIGFHTHDDTQYFLTCVSRILGIEHARHSLQIDQRAVRADAFPISIDFERFAAATQQPDVQEELQQIREQLRDQRAIISVDRLDYSKGIFNRLQGYEQFLERHPHWHGRVTLILVVVPSRIGVEHYQLMRKQINETVGHINGRYSRLDWQPVIYQYRYVPFAPLVALYAASDVALVTPLRDGMNLVAKEYVAARNDQTGVLILSEMAGAAKELTEAVIINPNNYAEIADAISEALDMPREEQVRRNAAMQARLRRYNVVRWADEFIKTLVAVREEQHALADRYCSPAVAAQIRHAYRRARRRLLLLDYDGTLVPFARTPEAARPSPRVTGLLARLAGDAANQVVIISGRERSTLEAWLGHLPLTLVAEHGAWARGPGRPWAMTEVHATGWKGALRPALETFVDQVPGSLIEEKDFSLAWHYRQVEPELGQLKAGELARALEQAVGGMGVEVLQGNKVIEVRNPAFNKGSAARRMLDADSFDFALAVGDDWTDEDLFRALPAWAFSVKVGLTPTAARAHVSSSDEVLLLLDQLAADLPEG